MRKHGMGERKCLTHIVRRSPPMGQQLLRAANERTCNMQNETQINNLNTI